MNNEENEEARTQTKWEQANKRRLTRLAQRMGELKNNPEIESSGDPFALELAAKLSNLESRKSNWGRHKAAIRTAENRRERARKVKMKDFDPDDLVGICTLEKALLFLSTFRQRFGLGFRSLQIMMLMAGKDPLTVQDTADICGVTYYAVRNDLTKMEKSGYVVVNLIRREGSHVSLDVLPTDKGLAILRSLNKFDPRLIGNYDRLRAMGMVQIPYDAKLLQCHEVITDASNIPLDY